MAASGVAEQHLNGDKKVTGRPKKEVAMMNMTRWDPFASSDDLFARAFPSFYGRFPRLALRTNGDTQYEWTPSADISETEKEYLIRAELPAVKKDDVKVTIDQGMVTIEGRRKHEKEDKSEKYHRVETFEGSFLRSFALPENVNAEAIRCESKDGVLTVHIPKTEVEKKKVRQVPVN
jgi:HSP20 family protein